MSWSTTSLPDVTVVLRAAQQDPEYARAIRYLTGAVKVARGEHEVVATYDDGALVSTVEGAAASAVPDDECQILVRGDEGHWQEMLQPFPRPFFQCLQTTSVKHGLELSSGPLTHAYLPALNRLLVLLRQAAGAEARR